VASGRTVRGRRQVQGSGYDHIPVHGIAQLCPAATSGASRGNRQGTCGPGEASRRRGQGRSARGTGRGTDQPAGDLALLRRSDRDCDSGPGSRLDETRQGQRRYELLPIAIRAATVRERPSATARSLTVAARTFGIRLAATGGQEGNDM